MRGAHQRPLWTRAGFFALLIHVAVLGEASAEGEGRSLAALATTVALSVPRGRAPFVSTAPTKFVQADFGGPLSSDVQPLELFEVTGAVR